MDFGDMMKVAGAGALGSGAANFFGGGKNPYDSAKGYFDQISPTMKSYLNPYISAGNKMMPDLTKTYGDIMNDPGSLISKIMEGYTKSPGFDFKRNEGLNSINNAAAAGGMLGTAQHQEDAGRLSTNLAEEDTDKYLQNALGLWGKGLSGKEGIAGMGFDASKSLAENLAQALMSQGNLSFAGTASENQRKGSMFSDLAGGAAAIFGL